MAGAIAGALHGDDAIDPAWITRVDAANRSDLTAIAEEMTAATLATERREMD